MRHGRTIRGRSELSRPWAGPPSGWLKRQDTAHAYGLANGGTTVPAVTPPDVPYMSLGRRPSNSPRGHPLFASGAASYRLL